VASKADLDVLHRPILVTWHTTNRAKNVGGERRVRINVVSDVKSRCLDVQSRGKERLVTGEISGARSERVTANDAGHVRELS